MYYVYQELLMLCIYIEDIFIPSLTHDSEFGVVTVRMFSTNLIVFGWQFLNFSKNYVLICLKFFFKFIYLFIGCIGSSLLPAGFLSSWGEWGLLFVAARGLLIAVACCRARALGARASVVVAHGLSSCGAQA